MERESNSMQALCRSGCGFYGNPSTDGLCSLCYKEALKKKQQPPQTASSAGFAASTPQPTRTASPTIPVISPVASPAPSPVDNHATIKLSQRWLGKESVEIYLNSKLAMGGRFSSSRNHSRAVIMQDPTDKSHDDKDTGESEAGAACASGSPASAADQSGQDLDDSSQDGRDDKDSKKKKNRCAMCRKKVGLTGFECRCGGLFCAVHRYSDKHGCGFDYRELGAQEIRRNNPVVVGEKIQKI